ncbi:MAG: glycoside hydrolase family 97 N-terminal domain-containing protein, partial [Muribaculaceae bacterium]|nr:glycoside hydrolase family 97 N-terminal domain-containing protein [Muribaculaceae bacterium]
MKKILTMLFILAGVMNLAAVRVTSPDGNLVLNVDVTADGTPYYTLDYKGKPITKDSRLGLKSDETAFTGGFRIVSADT